MQKTTSVIYLILLCLSLSLSHQASAQYNKKKARTMRNQNSRTAKYKGRKLAFANAKQYITLGVSAHALNYFGDIAPKSTATSTDISFTRPGLGVSSSVRVGSSLAVRAEFLYGRLSSSDYDVADPANALDVYRYARNLHFRNNIKDFSVVGVYDFFANPGSVTFRMGFTPYVFAGISLFHHNPKAKVPAQAVLYPGDSTTLPEAGKWVSLRPLHTEGTDKTYSPIQLSIPAGIGVRYRLTQIIDVEAEMSYRFLFTDYLDDVSTNYVDKGTLGSELAKVMSDRSLEATEVRTGENRFQNLPDNESPLNRTPVTYTGADGRQYLTLLGYGQPNQQRGGAKDNDIFIVTSIRVIFMIVRSPFSSKRGYRL